MDLWNRHTKSGGILFTYIYHQIKRIILISNARKNTYKITCIVKDLWKYPYYGGELLYYLSEGEVKPVPVRSRKEKNHLSLKRKERKLKLKDLAEHDYRGREEFLYLKK